MENDMFIPNGNTINDYKQRAKVIRNFYRLWKLEHPDQKVYNHSLKAVLFSIVLLLSMYLHKIRSRRLPTPIDFAPGMLGSSLPFGDAGGRGLLHKSIYVNKSKSYNLAQR